MTNTERTLRAEWRRIRAENPDRLAGCSFKINGRFKTKLGVCRSRRSDGMPVSVEIAKSLMAPGLEQQAMDTLYHEVAHALVGHAAGHGPVWKAMCVKLGAKPERLANLTTDERAVMSEVNKPKWTVGCQDCGTSAQRHVLKSSVKVNGRCARCGGLLWWRDNRTGREGRQHADPFARVFTVPEWRR